MHDRYGVRVFLSVFHSEPDEVKRKNLPTIGKSQVSTKLATQ